MKKTKLMCCLLATIFQMSISPLVFAQLKEGEEAAREVPDVVGDYSKPVKRDSHPANIIAGIIRDIKSAGPEAVGLSGVEDGIGIDILLDFDRRQAERSAAIPIMLEICDNANGDSQDVMYLMSLIPSVYAAEERAILDAIDLISFSLSEDGARAFNSEIQQRTKSKIYWELDWMKLASEKPLFARDLVVSACDRYFSVENDSSVLGTGNDIESKNPEQTNLLAE